MHKYFPEDDEEQLEVADTFVIKITKKTLTEKKDTRILCIYDSKTGKQIHEVKHIHFKAWEDFEVPDKQSTAELMACLQE